MSDEWWNKKRICITGSRGWDDESTIREWLLSLPDNVTIIDGDCKTGADAIVKKLCQELDIEIELYPAQWDVHGKSAGFVRNKQMVDICDVVVAFWDQKSLGTKHTIDLAKKQSKLEKVFTCDI